MTDAEIIKALERCPYQRDCVSCDVNACDNSPNHIMKCALSLINRQKAEIDGLQHRISELEAELDDLKRDDLPRCKDALRRANEIGMGLEKENQELRAEIERLQKHIKEGIVLAIQADAIKEFAERLKDKHKHNTTSVVSLVTAFDNINTLVKEMVGGNDG